MSIWNLLPSRFAGWLWSFKKDNCEVCLGSKGGMKGNENRIDGIVMCDYCSVWYTELRDKYEVS